MTGPSPLAHRQPGRYYRPGQPFRSKRRQAGGETVEFALTALLFFTVLFLIIDISLVMYNQGMTNHAARAAARQATLFWVNPDPNVFSVSDPRGNIRMREEMVDSMVDFYARLLVNPGNDTVDRTIDLNGAGSVSGTAPNRQWIDVSQANVSVDLLYPHDFVGITKLLNATGFELNASIGDADAARGLSTEADL
jgi:hypothetical protein